MCLIELYIQRQYEKHVTQKSELYIEYLKEELCRGLGIPKEMLEMEAIPSDKY